MPSRRPRIAPPRYDEEEREPLPPPRRGGCCWLLRGECLSFRCVSCCVIWVAVMLGVLFWSIVAYLFLFHVPQLPRADYRAGGFLSKAFLEPRK